MHEIVIISGKGGTGKTSICSALAILADRDAIIADCDVDAADMHLLMQPNVQKSEDFYSGYAAVIDPKLCINCGKCDAICRFEAIKITNSTRIVDPIACEGCGYCKVICPVSAIKMQEQNIGEIYISNIKSNTQMVHAHLRGGADNSGKLVAKVKKIASALAIEQDKKYIIVDGSPGIGCPVISSLSGAGFVLLITEPSMSGFHDLKRVFELAQKFHLPAALVINKADINPQQSLQIKTWSMQNKLPLLAEIPYNESFSTAMTRGQTIMEYNDPDIANIIRNIWEQLKQLQTLETT